MTEPVPLTDRAALLRNRARASLRDLFLHDIAQDDIKDRIALVNRDFTAPMIVTGLPEVWGGLVPNAQVIADTDILSVEPATHDLIIHAMSLHWANDPVGQLIQCRRALKPDGLFLGVMFAGQTLADLRSCLAEAEISLRGGLSPRVAPMADIRDLGALMQRAGFALPVADITEIPVEYQNLHKLMADLRTMGETNALSARDKRFSPKSLFKDAETRYRDLNGDGKLVARFDLAVLTGWAPSENQPQPLRPGTATTRLADALGTAETKLRD